MSAVFVDPLFTSAGIGRRLVADVEARAHQSGFKRFATRVTANAVPFFERLGYDIASHGVSTITMPVAAIPVTFLRKSVPVTLAVSDVALAIPMTTTRH